MPNFHEKAGDLKSENSKDKTSSSSSGGASPYHIALSPQPSSSIPTNNNNSNTAIKYLRFPISFWSRFVETRNNDNHLSLINFLTPLFKFVDNALANGENILIHCLAGAHRAGTTGVILLMRYSLENDVAVAIKIAKKLRPIIDPIGMLPELLKRYSLARADGVDVDKGCNE